jgi:hypothetical protein
MKIKEQKKIEEKKEVGETYIPENNYLNKIAKFIGYSYAEKLMYKQELLLVKGRIKLSTNIGQIVSAQKRIIFYKEN